MADRMPLVGAGCRYRAGLGTQRLVKVVPVVHVSVSVDCVALAVFRELNRTHGKL